MSQPPYHYPPQAPGYGPPQASGYGPSLAPEYGPPQHQGYAQPVPNGYQGGYPAAQAPQVQQAYQPAGYQQPYPSATLPYPQHPPPQVQQQQSFATLPHPPQGYNPGVPPSPPGAYPPLVPYSNQSTSLPTTQVELRVSCQNLPNLDLFSKSDPQVYLFIHKKVSVNSREQLTWQFVGKTEAIKNNLNPQFTTPFVLEYFFEQVQSLCFMVVDVDSQNRPDLHHQDFIGCIQIHLGQLVASSKARPFEVPLSAQPPPELARMVKPARPCASAKIKIIVEELSSCKQTIQLALSAQKLDKKDITLFGGSSDPFFEIQRPRDDPQNPFVTVYKSEYIPKNLNPVWKETSVKMSAINQGSLQKPFKIRVFDWDRDGTHDFIGEILVSVNDLISAMNEKRGLSLINPVTAQKKGTKYQNSGLLFVNKCLVVQEISFMDYISTGTEIALNVGIDFTGSNGDPRDRYSLHYMAPPVQQNLPNGTVGYYSPPNQYQTAISSVGGVLEAYDTDKKFPVYGFGLRMRANDQVYHCYPINGNFADPEVTAVSGILDVYQQFLSSGSFELYGPTNFSPLIHDLNQRVQSELTMAGSNQQTRLDVAGLGRYHILLIMTDGLITDMDATIEAIVESSSLPISIVIVGVGSEDFSAMNVLDGDGRVLRDRRGRVAERDCVQFVPMNKFPSRNHKEALAQETLAEIPRQFMEWVTKRRIQPKAIPK